MNSNAKISKITVVAAFITFVVIAIVKFSNDEFQEIKEIPFGRDYSGIEASLEINVALAENATEYCIHNAIPRGFQLETLEDFCKAHGLELNIIPVNNELVAEALLTLGKCDIIVKHTFLTDSTMSQPLLSSNLVILSRTKQIPDTIYVTGHKYFSTKHNGKTIICSDCMSQEIVARKVASGEINAAICDSALALTYQKAYPRLVIDTSICIAQDIVWKTHHKAEVLRDSIDSWLDREKETKHFKLRHEIY